VFLESASAESQLLSFYTKRSSFDLYIQTYQGLGRVVGGPSSRRPVQKVAEQRDVEVGR